MSLITGGFQVQGCSRPYENSRSGEPRVASRNWTWREAKVAMAAANPYLLALHLQLSAAVAVQRQRRGNMYTNMSYPKALLLSRQALDDAYLGRRPLTSVRRQALGPPRIIQYSTFLL